MQQLRVAHQQLMRGVAGSLRARLFDSDGDEATGLTVTVDVTRADGTALYTGSSATEDSSSTGTYTFALSASDLSSLDLLIATWKVSSVTRAVTVHEVVGGFYFTPKEAQDLQPSLASGSVSVDRVKTIRADVESEFERICGVAFVPRFARIRLDGSGTDELLLPDVMVRTIRSVRTYSDATTYVAATAGELAAMDVDDVGRVVRLDVTAFTCGRRNIVIEYEHGHDQPPADIRAAALVRLRERVNHPNAGVPDRALSFQIGDGGVYRLSTPAADRTGNPEVDATLARHIWLSRTIGIA